MQKNYIVMYRESRPYFNWKQFFCLQQNICFYHNAVTIYT